MRLLGLFASLIFVLLALPVDVVGHRWLALTVVFQFLTFAVFGLAYGVWIGVSRPLLVRH
jgi:hypothetical protein